MKELILNKTKNNQYISYVDDDDYELLNKFNWSYSKGYASTKMKGKKIMIHRFIMGAKGREFIDHKDRNPLNNQKNNLRPCNNSENQKNRKSAINSSSKYLGVCFIKCRNKFKSQIKNNNINYFLGYFKIEEQAALAYNEAAKKYHGEFANLNVVPIISEIDIENIKFYDFINDVPF